MRESLPAFAEAERECVALCHSATKVLEALHSGDEGSIEAAEEFADKLKKIRDILYKFVDTVEVPAEITHSYSSYGAQMDLALSVQRARILLEHVKLMKSEL